MADMSRNNDRLEKLEKRVCQFERSVDLMRDAADKAFEEAHKVNQLLAHLKCSQGEIDTARECPDAIKAVRHSIHDDDEDPQRDSLLEIPMSIGVGPLKTRGPAIILGGLTALIVLLILVLALTHSLPTIRLSSILQAL